MNTNANNDSKGSHTFNMNSLGKSLETPVDERSGEWASSTLSALGPATATTTTTATEASTSPAAYPSTMTTHPTMPITQTLGSTSAAVCETPAYSHKFPNPNPTNTISAADAAKEFKPASSPIFPDAAQTAIPGTTSAFSESPPPAISSKNNPFLEDHHIGKRDDLPELIAASAFTTISTPGPIAHNVESASTATTPGLQIPGAYPGIEKERVTHGDIEMAKAATAVALERAKELALATGETMMDVVDTVLPAVKAYLPSAETTKDAAITAGQSTANAGRAAGNTAADAAGNIPEVHPVETTKSYLASASDVIRNYVPAAVSAYLPVSTQPTTTLPSQETGQNLHPSSSGGVGPLPGPPGEIGIAMLPDERTAEGNIDDLHRSAPKLRAENNPTHTGGVGNLPGEAGESGVAILPEERNRAKLPSAQPGLGLPGDKDEAGVAVLPIERGAGGEHVLMEKDAHNMLVGADPGPEQFTRHTVDTNNASDRNGSVAFIEPPFEPTANVYTNSPLPPPPPCQSKSLQSPMPISNTASTVDGASADASIRSLAGSKKGPFEQNSNPINTTTNTIPHPEPNTVPNPTLNKDTKTPKGSVKPPIPAPALTAAAAPVTLVGGVVGGADTTDGGNAGIDGVGYAHGLTREDQHAHAAPEESHVDKKNRAELVHQQDSTTATQGHGAPGTAISASPSPDGTSHEKSASTSSGSSTGKKPSLFSKMKGEMKVISGKIGHNEEKIEEGRRLMGKTLN